jgi:predicted ThiF/HesA family dinucleotide-utilizing enzyme
VDFSVSSNVWEDIQAKVPEGKIGIVGVGRVIFKVVISMVALYFETRVTYLASSANLFQ